jgi:outer membrane biosynthesis protein TonB
VSSSTRDVTRRAARLRRRRNARVAAGAVTGAVLALLAVLAFLDPASHAGSGVALQEERSARAAAVQAEKRARAQGRSADHDRTSSTVAPAPVAPEAEPTPVPPAESTPSTTAEEPAPSPTPSAVEPAPRPSPSPTPQPQRTTAAPSGDAPSAGMFPLLAPGAPLPSGEECAARVQRNAWEPKPENTTANSTRPSGPAPYGMHSWYTPAADADRYRGRVDGNFTGTTDEIIQWASCKWGFPTDLNRAQAVIETTWNQAFVGDGGESFGLYQMRVTYWGAHPNSASSTAFNADWTMGLRRACYEGAMWYSELAGNLEACIGVHFSGDPAEGSWREYTDAVLEAERSKPWLDWPSAAGTAPRAGRP